MNKITQILLIAVLLLGGVVFLQHRRTVKLTDERDRYKQNNTALLTDMKRMQIDSARMAVDTKALRLTIDEYEEYRAKDAEVIKQLGFKIKNLQAVAKHQLEVQAPINAVIRDTVTIRDTIPLIRPKVEMITPHIQLTGMIEDNHLKGSLKVPVTLNQAVWVEYKGCWFWKRVKAIHQTISSDNPYVEIKYSEYIQINKR